MFKLQFPTTDIKVWASRRYDITNDAWVMNEVIPRVKARGYFDKADFIAVAEWKTPRVRKHYHSNSAEEIRDVTTLALSTRSERLRIESLLLLRGVSWPVASVILHLAHKDPYPILDFHVLWSLGVDVQHITYNFAFWWAYTEFCRQLSDENQVDMRTLDRALWQYSKENQ